MSGIAHELITRGWTQGAYEATDGSVCLEGAACRAFGVAYGSLDLHVFTVVEQAIGIKAQVGVPVTCVPTWNDAPGRTFDEVLRVAKKADEILDAP